MSRLRPTAPVTGRPRRVSALKWAPRHRCTGSSNGDYEDSGGGAAAPPPPLPPPSDPLASVSERIHRRPLLEAVENTRKNLPPRSRILQPHVPHRRRTRPPGSDASTHRRPRRGGWTGHLAAWRVCQVGRRPGRCRRWRRRRSMPSGRWRQSTGTAVATYCSRRPVPPFPGACSCKPHPTCRLPRPAAQHKRPASARVAPGPAGHPNVRQHWWRRRWCVARETAKGLGAGGCGRTGRGATLMRDLFGPPQ